jgi:intracellular sulfur oxidation DsrE/DsrF family protein
MTARREFIAQIGAAAAGFALDIEDANELRPPIEGPWDNSWIKRVEAGKYRVVFNTSDISDGAVFSYVSTFFDHFRETHETTDSDTRAVSVFRRLGTVMALNDAMWDRYALGEDRKVDDPVTKAPARRNIFWKRPAGQGDGNTIEALHARGLVSLVCNVSIGSMSMSFARKTGGDVDTIKKELLANLVPGAILVPSGIYALIRAQNAGCAFMAGT